MLQLRRCSCQGCEGQRRRQALGHVIWQCIGLEQKAQAAVVVCQGGSEHERLAFIVQLKEVDATFRQRGGQCGLAASQRAVSHYDSEKGCSRGTNERKRTLSQRVGVNSSFGLFSLMATAPIACEVVGMMTKLDERVHGMRKLCDSVRAAAAPLALPLLHSIASVRRVLLLVTVDDIPLPNQSDYLDEDGTLRLHFQSIGTANHGATLFPDFVFGSWWHIGLHDFDEFAEAMSAASSAPAVHPQAFWIGNVAMSTRRAELVSMSQAHPERIEARGMHWAHARGNVAKATGSGRNGRWVSLPDHARWRYLIDVEGMGWSGRLKLLPFSRRPLLIQDGFARRYWDWASAMMRPHEHFLPVKRDLSDLLKRLEWLDQRPDEAARLADAAFKLASTHFTWKSAVRQGVNLTIDRIHGFAAQAANVQGMVGQGMVGKGMVGQGMIGQVEAPMQAGVAAPAGSRRIAQSGRDGSAGCNKPCPQRATRR